MSTQHPDNVRQPFFVESSVIAGDDEIKEAFYSFSHLKIREQLWDCEGKETDNYVVEKLLTRYPDYFKRHKLGEDRFITLRGPNPGIEKNQAKILLETLESIPRNSDIATQFYGERCEPIFEVSIPMTRTADDVLMVKEYYEKNVSGKGKAILRGRKIEDWVGTFSPKKIKIIPLLEEKEAMLASDKIAGEYLAQTKEEQLRVWLARSDPALNYGYLPAVLLNKVSLLKLDRLEESTSVPIHPIIGCGSVPFRGNFRPDNIDNCLSAYPSVQTFTLQSAFKFDYPEDKVRAAVEELESGYTQRPKDIDEEKAVEIIEKISAEYQKEITLIAPLVNQVAQHIPKRRKRKLHIGLFGYSRQANSVTLPRAITFCASLYSLGIPPELLGMSALSEKDMEFVWNDNFEADMKDSLRYLNQDNLRVLPQELQERIKKTASRFNYETDEKHKKVTSFILDGLEKSKQTLSEDIERAAALRNFLG
ncbi:MAG: phosphoenolpyruvate carboxylase [Nanoarchaeota archaeon]|nr:phosphoenolpyruvate carboxylase [Nanoarchaeota archaeon]